MLRFIFAMPLLIHGAAHISGYLASWTKRDQGFNDNPWLFSKDITIKTPLGRSFGILWLLSMIAFISSGVAIVLAQFWWVQAVLAGSVLSLIAIVPWWKTVSYAAKIGAIFDLLLIGFILCPWCQQIMDVVFKGMR